MFQLTDLPDTLFLEVLSHLQPSEIVLHHVVSRASHAALTRPDLSKALLHFFFPRSLECRVLRSIQSRSQNLFPDDDAETADWSLIFATVSRRYHNLATANFHSVGTIPLLHDEKLLQPFTPWSRLLRRDGMSAPLQLPDASWTYADGVLIYPSAPTPSTRHKSPVFQALHLASGASTTVPFEWASKVVRRARLAQGVLVVEWAEAEGSHPLNEGEIAHRHFATAYDVRSTSTPLCQYTSEVGALTATFRSEWKIHYLGLPLSQQDRILSAHTATHYALYAHQPTRSPWGEDAPLERLVVWALNGPSTYKPSLDPSSSRRPEPDPGPAVILRLTNGGLDHWGVRQRDTPRVMHVVLDTPGPGVGESGHVVLQEEDHLWIAGPQSSPNPPARHSVRSTAIPLSGFGPRWVDECGADGDAERSFCPGAGAGLASWPGRAPCWRHEEFPYLTVAEVVDAPAGTRVCGRRCFAMETVSVSVAGSSSSSSSSGRTARGEVQFGDDVWRTVMSGAAALAGDERWLVGEDAAGDVSVVRF